MAYEMATAIGRYIKKNPTDDPVIAAALACGYEASDNVDWHRPHSGDCRCGDCLLWLSVRDLALACGYEEKE